MKVADIFRTLRELGVGIELKGDRIALSGSKGKLSPGLLKRIGELKQEIVFLLKAQRHYSHFQPVAPVEKRDFYPVSSSQHRLFILQALQPSSVQYNMPKVVPLTGTILPGAVEGIFAVLCHRHESLRTYFTSVDQLPVQRVVQDRELKIQHPTDLGDFVRPFDLSRPLLWRLGLIRQSESAYLLLMDIHHIIADGVSISIIVREIMSMLRQKELPALKLQYRDFSHWQLENSRKGLLQSQRDYWLRVFRQKAPILDLPTDFTRPPEHSGAGKTRSFIVGNDILDQLIQLIRGENSTLFICLLAVFNVLLAKLSGIEDIVVGVPVAGRNHADLEGIVGMLVNTLPLRNFPGGDLTFRQFLAEVKERALQGFENQDLPFADLLAGLQMERDLGRHPLFDVMFNLLNYGSFNMKLSESDLDKADSGHKEGTAKFDLNLSAIEIDGGLYCEMEYYAGLFKSRTIDRFILYFKRLVADVALSPDRRLSAFQLVTDDERASIMEAFDRNESGYSYLKTVSSLFQRQVNRRPDAVGLTLHRRGGEHMTLGELRREGCELAMRLKRRGVSPGSVVALVAERSFEMVVGILGILELGACYLPLDPNTPPARQRFFVDDSAACVAVCGVDRRMEGIETVPLRLGRGRNSVEGVSLNPTGGGPEDPVYLIYTSGSTGRPKGALIQQHSLVNRLLWMGERYSIGANDVMLQKTSFSFDVSVTELLGWAVWGSRLTLLPPGGEKEATAILDAVSINGITLIHFVPSMLRVFIECVKLKEQEMKLASLRRVYCSGEPLTKGLAAQFYQMAVNGNGIGLSNLYGPTEAAIDVSYYDCPLAEKEKSIPIGTSIDNVRLYILDSYGNLQPPGVVGELYIAGIAVGMGYLNKPEKTAEVFVEDVFYRGERMYRTGDLARWRYDGQIEFLGRKDQQVKIRGYRIELPEIEACMAGIPWILDAVVTMDESTGTPLLCAYLTSYRQVGPFELREGLAELLPDYMIPACVTQLEEMPLNASGKVDRGALPPPDLEFSLQTYAPPRDEREAKVVEIWRKILGAEDHDIGIDDNFFLMGGDSIKANAMNIELFRQFGVEIPMADFFTFPTIRQQMTIINTGE
jgi:amino acid adenylation domain-containing protein